MTNFNNYFFFRSNEYEVQNLCNNMTFTSATNERNIGFLAEPESATPPQNIEVENLDTGYAYVKLANGYRSNVPLKMERLYVKLLPEPKDKPEQPDYQKICISAIKPYLKELELTKLMKDYDV